MQSFFGIVFLLRGNLREKGLKLHETNESGIRKIGRSIRAEKQVRKKLPERLLGRRADLRHRSALAELVYLAGHGR